MTSPPGQAWVPRSVVLALVLLSGGCTTVTVTVNEPRIYINLVAGDVPAPNQLMELPEECYQHNTKNSSP